MPGPKTNNNRKYPSANRQPRHKAADRIGRALARQEVAASLTLEQKIAKLPPEPFSAKQRARYLAQLVKRNTVPQAFNLAEKPEVVVDVAGSKPNKTKKYMKGSK